MVDRSQLVHKNKMHNNAKYKNVEVIILIKKAIENGQLALANGVEVSEPDSHPQKNAAPSKRVISVVHMYEKGK